MRTIPFIVSLVAVWLIQGCDRTNSPSQTDQNKPRCGNVSIARMNWASAELLAVLDDFILAKGYGCKTKLVRGDTIPTFASMTSKQNPDVAPELAVSSLGDRYQQALGQTIIALNPQPLREVSENWYIDQKTASEHPELKTVQDVLARPDLFPHPVQSNQGGFHTCPAGWACQFINQNLFDAFDMAQRWSLIRPGSSAGLDVSIARSAVRGQPWFGYYWQPTTIAAKYGLVRLDWGVEFQSEQWKSCFVKDLSQSKTDQVCADLNPSAWAQSQVETIVTTQFKDAAPQAVQDYLTQRSIDSNALNQMLNQMSNQRDPKQIVHDYLKEHQTQWQGWINDQVVIQNIQEALKDEGYASE